MANFLTTTSPGQQASDDANADAVASANRRKTAAYNALAATYGPAAGDPEAQAQLIANQTNQDEQSDKENIVSNQSNASDLALDQSQRADNAWQGQAVLNAVRRGVAAGQAPADALSSVSHYLPALGVDPAHVQPLADAITQDPTLLDKIGQQLGPLASQSKIQGSPVYTVDAQGKYHISYPQADGTLQELALPPGQSLTSSPDKVAAQGIAADKAAATGAAFTTDLKAETVAPMISGLIPGARITGLGRTPQGNADVGGVPNSAHLSDQAVDFVAPVGTKLSDVVAHLRSQGVPVTEAINEGQAGDQGPHFHIGWAPKPTAAQTNAAIAGNSGGALSDTTMQDLYDRQKASGTAPVFGSGAAGTAMRAQYYGFQAKADASQGGAQAAVSAAQAGKAAQAYQVDLTRSTPNSNGGRVNAFNTLLNHADVTQSLATAMQGGNLNLINQAKAAYQQATGNPAPTNLALAANALADETARAIVGSSAVFDRKEFVKAFSNGNSPAQWAGALGTVKDLATGQLTSLRQTATSVGPGATAAFDAHLTPKAKALIGVGAPAAPGGAPNIAALRSKYGL